VLVLRFQGVLRSLRWTAQKDLSKRFAILFVVWCDRCALVVSRVRRC